MVVSNIAFDVLKDFIFVFIAILIILWRLK